ncbi:MAG: hypothetical protein V9G19_21950 [Tetrasphaera sp.]
MRELSARAVDPEEPSAEAEMDLPARQRLSILVRAVTDLPTIEIGAHRGLFADIVAQLTAYPDLRGLALTVAARAIDWEAPLPGLEAVIGLVDEPLRCADLRSAVAEAVARHSDPPTPALSEAVDEILMRDTLAAGTAALTVVAWAGPQAGWNALWRNKLRVLRTNPSLTLAGWARDIVTGPPTEPR